MIQTKYPKNSLNLKNNFHTLWKNKITYNKVWTNIH